MKLKENVMKTEREREGHRKVGTERDTTREENEELKCKRVNINDGSNDYFLFINFPSHLILIQSHKSVFINKKNLSIFTDRKFGKWHLYFN